MIVSLFRHEHNNNYNKFISKVYWSVYAEARDLHRKNNNTKINVNECALLKQSLETMLAIQGQQINGDLHQAGKQLLLPGKIARHAISTHLSCSNCMECLTMQATIRNYTVNWQKVKANMDRDSIKLTPSCFYLLFPSGKADLHRVSFIESEARSSLAKVHPTIG